MDHGAQKCPHAFGFDTVCDALGINPGVLRRRMLIWKHETRRNVETRAADAPSADQDYASREACEPAAASHRAQVAVPAF